MSSQRTMLEMLEDVIKKEQISDAFIHDLGTYARLQRTNNKFDLLLMEITDDMEIRYDPFNIQFYNSFYWVVEEYKSLLRALNKEVKMENWTRGISQEGNKYNALFKEELPVLI